MQLIVLILLVHVGPVLTVFGLWYWTTHCQIERWGWWQTEGDRQPGCLSLTFPWWAEDSASGDAMHGAVPRKEAYAVNGGGHIHRHTFMHTDTQQTLVIFKQSLSRGMKPKLTRMLTRTDWQKHAHTNFHGHSATNWTLETLTDTQIHNLCKWAPAAPWHVADAQLSCPHPASKPDQRSPLRARGSSMAAHLNFYHFCFLPLI